MSVEPLNTAHIDNALLNRTSSTTGTQDGVVPSSSLDTTKRSIAMIFKANLTQTIIMLLSLVLTIISIIIYTQLLIKQNAIINQIAEKKAVLTETDNNYQQALSQLTSFQKDKDLLFKSFRGIQDKYGYYLLNLNKAEKENERLVTTIKEFKDKKDTPKEINEYKTAYTNNLLSLAKFKIINNGIHNEKMKGKISEILTEDKIRLLEQWTKKTLLFACFNTNIHPMSGRQFHQQCDMYSETITLIVTEYATIGGYTSQDWSGNQKKFDDKAFVFNLNTMKKYDIRPGKVAISTLETDMPVFAYDIALSKDNQYVLFPSSYGKIEDKEEFGIPVTMITALLVEVIVVN